MLKIRKTCRICGSPLQELLDFGEQYVAGYTNRKKLFKFTKRKIPLVLSRCNYQHSDSSCGLVQLKHTTPSFLLFRNYFYRSSINDSMVEHLCDIGKIGLQSVSIENDDIVIDIGSNDGTLLKWILQNYNKVRCVAFEPAINLSQYYKNTSIQLIKNFFNVHDFQRDIGQNLKAKVIFSIAMLYDLEDPQTFVDSISEILHPEGVWIFEQSYLPSMLNSNAFDTICMEHLEYYSLAVIEYLLKKANLRILDVSLNNINGGSILIKAGHIDAIATDEANEKLYNLRLNEFEMQIDTLKPYIEFKQRVDSNCTELKHFVREQILQHKTIYAYGASTKGSVTLQYCDLDGTLIKACVDRNPIKHGLIMGGLDIPIISEEEARQNPPDYFLILPWHFLDNFLEREKEFLMKGGKFIVPMPKFRVIDQNG